MTTSFSSDFNREDDIPKFTKKKIIKNIVLIALAYFLLYISYDGLSMLQTSMNQKKGIGVYSQAAVYLVFGVGSLLLPKYMIKKVGCKTAIFVGMAMYLPYVASNYYPEFYTMIPASALLGIGGSLMWGAQSTYYNECCFRYWTLINNSRKKQKKSPSETDVHFECDYSNDKMRTKTDCNSSLQYDDTNPEVYTLEIQQLPPDEVLNKISVDDGASSNPQDLINNISFSNKGLKEAFNNEHQHNTICTTVESADDNIPDSFENKDDSSKTVSLDSINAMFFGFHGFVYQSCMFFSNLMSYIILNKGHSDTNITMPVDCYCGAQFCNDPTCFESEVLEMPSDLRYMLTTISLIVGVFGVLLIFFFLDQLGDRQKSVKFSFELLFASVLHAKKKEQIFLIPLSFYVGMEQGFFIGDYTRSYVACSLGTYRVGLITMVFGVTGALASSLCGVMVKFIGRIPVFLIGLAIDIVTSLLLLLWTPNPDQLYMFYITSAFFGIFTGIFWSQVVAFYGILFREDQEAAFGFHYLCSSLGSTLSFAYNDYLCSHMKIYALLTVITLGLFGYITSERLFYIKKKVETNEK